MDRQNLHAEKAKTLKYLLYPLLGMLVFYTNSQLNFNYFIKSYLSLIELQIGVVVIYFLTSKIKKKL